MIFGVGFLALIAAEALEAVSVLSEPLALTLAVVARHGAFPLESHSVLPDNEFAGSSRRKLWWILTPVGVDALAGVFYYHPTLYLLVHEVKKNIWPSKYLDKYQHGQV